jgi:hypothetical protein
MSRSDSDDTTALPLPSPDVVSRRLGDEVVLVHLQTNRIFALNPTGARFWELLLGGMSRGEIEATLGSEYEVPAEQVAAEIDILVSELRRERIVGPGPTG